MPSTNDPAHRDAPAAADPAAGPSAVAANPQGPLQPGGAAAAPAAGAVTSTSVEAAVTTLRGLLTKENLAKVATAVRLGAVVAARRGLVPIAESYAQPPSDVRKLPTDPANSPPDRLTALEMASLTRAGQKLVLEAGDLFVGLAAIPGAPTKLPDRSANAEGSRGEPSLVMAVAAAKVAKSAYDTHAAKKTEEKRQAEFNARAVNLQPVSINVLRARNRG